MIDRCLRPSRNSRRTLTFAPARPAMQACGAAQGVARLACGRVSIHGLAFAARRPKYTSFGVLPSGVMCKVPSLARCRRRCRQETDERGRRGTIFHCRNALPCRELRRKALNCNALPRHLDIGKFRSLNPLLKGSTPSVGCA